MVSCQRNSSWWMSDGLTEKNFIIIVHMWRYFMIFACLSYLSRIARFSELIQMFHTILLLLRFQKCASIDISPQLLCLALNPYSVLFLYLHPSNLACPWKGRNHHESDHLFRITWVGKRGWQGSFGLDVVTNLICIRCVKPRWSLGSLPWLIRNPASSSVHLTVLL